VGKAIYAIDAFPEDDQLWRFDWIGGVRYNASVPSESLIDICLAHLPSGEANPLIAKSRTSDAKTLVRIGVGLLPYISIASVWQKRRPVAADFAAYRRQLRIDTRSCRTEMLGDLTANHNGIPRTYYLFAGMSTRRISSIDRASTLILFLAGNTRGSSVSAVPFRVSRTKLQSRPHFSGGSTNSTGSQ
jgi:hypothetical protein